MTIYEEAYTLVRRLPPVEQARLISEVTVQLHGAAIVDDVINDASGVGHADEEDEAYFAQLYAEMDSDWEAFQAEMAAERSKPPLSKEESERKVRQLFQNLSPRPLSHEEAMEMALSDDFLEWNMKL